MAIELRLQLKLSQQLVMTPQLQQAIKLLQLNRMELSNLVQQELTENPILEELEGEEVGHDAVIVPYFPRNRLVVSHGAAGAGGAGGPAGVAGVVGHGRRSRHGRCRVHGRRIVDRLRWSRDHQTVALRGAFG